MEGTRGDLHLFERCNHNAAAYWHYRAVLRKFGKVTEFVVEAGQDLLDVFEILPVFLSNFQFIKKASLSFPILVGILAYRRFEEPRRF